MTCLCCKYFTDNQDTLFEAIVLVEYIEGPPTLISYEALIYKYYAYTYLSAYDVLFSFIILIKYSLTYVIKLNRSISVPVQNKSVFKSLCVVHNMCLLLDVNTKKVIFYVKNPHQLAGVKLENSLFYEYRSNGIHSRVIDIIQNSQIRTISVTFIFYDYKGQVEQSCAW